MTYRLQCTDAGFTVDSLTSVTVEDSRYFTQFRVLSWFIFRQPWIREKLTHKATRGE